MRSIGMAVFLAAVTLVLASEQAQPQAPTITKEQMVKFVEEAAAYVKEVGRKQP